MSLTHILSKVYAEPWFITHGGFLAIEKLLKCKLTRSDNEDSLDLSMFSYKREPMFIDQNGIAHIEIYGTLAKGISGIEKCCGATDYEDIEDDLEAAIEGNARGIWLEIDSPGGACTGNSEIADMLQIISKTIPTVAFTDGLMCSAAYNIGVSAREIWATPSSTIGSIGAIIPWEDTAVQWQIEGKAFDPITNAEGDLKGSMMGPSLTAAQRIALTEYVQDSFNLFKSNVLRNRNVPEEAMRGQVFLANRAMQNKLIDKISTEDLAYARLIELL